MKPTAYKGYFLFPEGEEGVYFASVYKLGKANQIDYTSNFKTREEAIESAKKIVDQLVVNENS